MCESWLLLLRKRSRRLGREKGGKFDTWSATTEKRRAKIPASHCETITVSISGQMGFSLSKSIPCDISTTGNLFFRRQIGWPLHLMSDFRVSLPLGLTKFGEVPRSLASEWTAKSIITRSAQYDEISAEKFPQSSYFSLVTFYWTNEATKSSTASEIGVALTRKLINRKRLPL